MSRRIFKCSGVMVLALALLYLGVAWALDACGWTGGHAEHAAGDSDHVSHVSSIVADDEVPLIHCASLNEQVGPAARVAPTEVRRSDNGVALHAASFSLALFAARPNALWLEALFREARGATLSSDLARHLFLSVLQI